MNHEKRFQHAMAELKAKNIMTAVPPFIKLLIALGFRVRPPHYASFITNLCMLGTLFGVFLMLLLTLLLFILQGFPFFICILIGIFAGLLFGLAMAVYYSASARKNALTQWEDLSE